MLQKSTLEFLSVLSQNNSKEWMDANRAFYEKAKIDFEQLVAQIIQILAESEPNVGMLKTKDCIFRLNRDVRFSTDKSPYKIHFGAAFSRDGKKFPGAGYYVHIQQGASFIAGGIWMPDAPLLKKVRQEIDYNFEEFISIIQQKSFQKYFKTLEGERLKRAPQGYTEDNPAISYLKLKSFTVSTPLKDESILSARFLTESKEVFNELAPFINFLNKAI